MTDIAKLMSSVYTDGFFAGRGITENSSSEDAGKCLVDCIDSIKGDKDKFKKYFLEFLGMPEGE